MLNQLKLGHVIGAVAGALAVCCFTTTAHALVSELEAAQQANGTLTHQWKFEGDTDATRLLDSKGSLDLAKVAGPGGMGVNDADGMPGSGDEVPWSYPAGDVNNIGFEPGFEGAGNSQAYRPEKNAAATSAFGEERVAQSRSGAGLVAQTFATPTNLTIEAIVSPDAWEDTANTLAYVAQTRPGTSDRGYYLAQSADTNPFAGDGNLTGIVGQNFGDRPPIVSEYTAGHWFYVAVTYEGLDANPAIANAYYKNLTTDGPLVHAVVDHAFTINGSLVGSSGPLGVGLFAINNPADSAQEFFNGSIENLAVYGSVLTGDQIAQHARGVPEPASMLLVSLGGLAMLMFGRRAH
jgi:hypothetical protein